MNAKRLIPVVDMRNITRSPRAGWVYLFFLEHRLVGLIERRGRLEMRRPNPKKPGLFMLDGISKGDYWLSNGSERRLQLIPYGDTFFWRWVEGRR